MIRELKFTFGAFTRKEIISNYILVYGYEKVQIKNIDGFEYIFIKYNNEFIFTQLIRKPPRIVKRTSPLIADHSYHANCKICMKNDSCILIEPCNHFGMCNACFHVIFHHGFTTTNELNKFLITHKRCPFCKSEVDGVSYVYIP
jgi:hypothetical protein